MCVGHSSWLLQSCVVWGEVGGWPRCLEIEAVGQLVVLAQMDQYLLEQVMCQFRPVMRDVYVLSAASRWWPLGGWSSAFYLRLITQWSSWWTSAAGHTTMPGFPHHSGRFSISCWGSPAALAAGPVVWMRWCWCSRTGPPSSSVTLSGSPLPVITGLDLWNWAPSRGSRGRSQTLSRRMYHFGCWNYSFLTHFWCKCCDVTAHRMYELLKDWGSFRPGRFEYRCRSCFTAVFELLILFTRTYYHKNWLGFSFFLSWFTIIAGKCAVGLQCGRTVVSKNKVYVNDSLVVVMRSKIFLLSCHMFVQQAKERKCRNVIDHPVVVISRANQRRGVRCWLHLQSLKHQDEEQACRNGRACVDHSPCRRCSPLEHTSREVLCALGGQKRSVSLTVVCWLPVVGSNPLSVFV